MLQHPVGTELEERLGPNLCDLHLHSAARSEAATLGKHTTGMECHQAMWRMSDMHCFSTSPLDSQSSPLVRSGLLGTARVPLGSATCMSWGGAHYRTFDRKHFHFQGSCTYLLASSTDGTWAVYISTICDQRGNCNKVIIPCQTHPVVEDVLYVGTKHIFGRHTNNQISVRISFQALRMMLGLDLVSIHHKNVTLNSLPVPNGEPLFQNGKTIIRKSIIFWLDVENLISWTS